MNKLYFLLLGLLLTSHASLTYTVDIDRSGFSSVTLSLEDEQEANITLPEDARNLRIVGGSYSKINDTALVRAGKTGFATFSFSSDALTSKTDSTWKLLFFPPARSTTLIYMPPYATVEDSFPQPRRVSAEDSRTLLETGHSKNITVYYRLEEQPLPVAESDMPAFYILAAAIVLASAAVVVSIILRGGTLMPSRQKKAERKPTLGITAGKKDMMETFNGNDTKIVVFLLSNKGKSRRNELERETGISKSSLAMALNRLEKREVIEIDRTSTTHFVKLSERFLKL
jgi:uncharacterized membrane protein